MTIRSIASALKVSPSTAHKFTRAGMPTDTIEAAQAWVRERAKTRVTPVSDTASLAAKRGRKLDLECTLLALRIERESSNTEFLEVGEALQSVRRFLVLSHLSLKMRADAAVERLAGEADPAKIAAILGEIHGGAWLEATIGMHRQCRDDRMGAAIAATIRSEFCLLDEAKIEALGKELFGQADRVDTLANP
jgi:hypothetical protein